jgi:hypothetical protein
MRTKTLLLAALLTLSGMVASFAQSNVYSINVVGYVTVTVTNDTVYRILNTPLGPVNNTNNFVSLLVPNPPEGTQISKLADPAVGYETVTFGFGSWDNDIGLPVGTGFFIKLGEPGSVNITFVGEVQQRTDSNRQLLNGLTLVGSMVPQNGSLVNTLLIPGGEGNQVSRLLPNGGYETITFGFGSWDNDLDIAVAEGFFYSNVTGASVAWNRDFVIP